MEKLKLLFEQYRENNLKLQLESEFFRHEVSYLGHVITDKASLFVLEKSR